MKRTPDYPTEVKVLPHTADTKSVQPEIEQFYFHCRLKNLTEKTLSVYGERLNHFSKFIHQERRILPQVDKTTVQRYILSMQHCSGHTINGRLRVLKLFFGFLKREELWNGRPNPTEGIDFLHTEHKVKPVLSQEHITSMLKQCNRKHFTGARNYCIVHTFWDTLIRLSELINLRLSDLDLKSGSIHVVGKGRKERILPLGLKSRSHLHRYLARHRETLPGDHVFCTREGTPLRHRHVGRIISRLGVRCGIHVSPHLIRHSAATHLALTGMPPFLLQRLLGHSTLSTTNIYIHLVDDARLTEAYARFSPGDVLGG